MAKETFLNDPIIVTAAIDQQGQTTPKAFTWQGKSYTLTAVGRQWDTDEGRHILVESANGDCFELQLSRADLVWRLKRAWQGETVV
jgi:hypothetical protein